MILFGYHLVHCTLCADKVSTGLISNSNVSAKVVYPDTSKMTIYDPRQKSGMRIFSLIIHLVFTFIKFFTEQFTLLYNNKVPVNHKIFCPDKFVWNCYMTDKVWSMHRSNMDWTMIFYINIVGALTYHILMDFITFLFHVRETHQY